MKHTTHKSRTIRAIFTILFAVVVATVGAGVADRRMYSVWDKHM